MNAAENSIHVRFETAASYLLAIASGPYSMAGVMTGFQSAVRECMHQKCVSLVVDVRDIQGKISTTDRFAFGENMARALLDIELRLAFLCRADQMTKEGFLQNVMKNRGAQVCIATDMARIHVWLADESR